MANLNLTNQQQERDQIAPFIQQLKDKLNQRKPIWDKLSDKKKKKWITSGKDPIMTLAWQTRKFLNNLFGEGVDDA